MRGQRKNPRKAVQPFENKKRKIDIFKNYEANGVEKIQRKLEIFSTLISKKSTGERLVLAVSTVLHKPFSSVKIANDVILVLLALLLSYCVFHEIRGLREGSVISALCVGIFVKFWLAGLTKLFKRAPADTE